MKKSLLLLSTVFMFLDSPAQNGLESVIVEKYYISDENDTTTNPDGGVLPVGSVTYRVFADLLPGYKFQAAYGVPWHEMKIATTTTFFNNEDRGAKSPTYTLSQATNNTVMLDSWLTSGAVSADGIGVPNRYGVLKSEDNGIGTIVNADGVLQNADPLAGIPLSQEDGFIIGAPEECTFVGIDIETNIFDAESTGNLFSTFNGSWAALNGATGPTSTNRVLIGQFTTDGIFSFELNIQVGTPTGGVQNFVARNPIGDEVVLSSLIYENVPEVNLNLKAYIQGLYQGGGLMAQGLDFGTDETDSIFVKLANANPPYDYLAETFAILKTDGNARSRVLRNFIGDEYYIVISL